MYFAISVAALSPYTIARASAGRALDLGARLSIRTPGSYAFIPAGLFRASVRIFRLARRASVRKQCEHQSTLRTDICFNQALMRYVSSLANLRLSFYFKSVFFAFRSYFRLVFISAVRKHFSGSLSLSFLVFYVFGGHCLPLMLLCACLLRFRKRPPLFSLCLVLGVSLALSKIIRCSML